MRVTVIPSDRWVRRDEESAVLSEWPFDDAHIHAIQWYEDEGEIELAGRRPVNEPFTDPAILQPYLDALDAHLEAVAAMPLPGSSAEVTPSFAPETDGTANLAP